MLLKRTLTAAVALLISSTTLADQNSLFVQKYLNSFASRDAEGIFALINWEGVEKKEAKALKKYIKSGFRGRQIRRIYIEPVDNNVNPSYIREGKTYELNLIPSGTLNIVYISNNGKRTTNQLYVGQHDGEMLIGSGVPAPESLACTDTTSKTKSC